MQVDFFEKNRLAVDISGEGFEEGLNIIRNIPSAVYDRRKRVWIMSMFDMLLLLDLCKEKVKVFLSAEAKERVDKFWLEQEEIRQSKQKGEVSLEYMRTVPFKHQVSGVNFLYAVKRGMLLDEQGLGKTKVVIDVCKRWQNEGKIKTILVVCPKSLMYTWVEELKKHSFDYNSVQVLSGSREERIEKLYSSPVLYTIINYEGVRLLKEEIGQFQWGCVVFDECHFLKNLRAQRTTACSRIRGKYVILVSGTPLVNRCEDLYTLFSLVDKSIFPSFRKFLERYCIREEKVFGWGRNRRRVWVTVGNKNEEELREKLSCISIRRTKEECLDLPPKLYQVRYLEMLPGQSSVYWNYYKKKEEAFKKGDLTAKLGILVKLSQISCNPRNLGIDQDSSKLKELDVLVEENSKLVVWCCFVQTLKEIVLRYEEYNPVCVYGETSIIERQEAIEKFRDDDSCRLFVGNPSVAGYGITLTAGSVAVYVHKDFSYVNWIQSQDRIHRIGATKNVTIISLVNRNTVDELVERALEKKQDLSEYLLRDNLYVDGRT